MAEVPPWAERGCNAWGLIDTIGQDAEYIYSYDAANMRSRVDYGSHWRETLYLGNTLIAFRSDANSQAWTDVIDSGNQRVAVELPNGTTQYHVTDHLGSMAASTSSAGAILNMTELTPFGVEVSAPGSTNLLFTGKECDPESGLDYFGGRFYSSTMWRFVSPDPTGLRFSQLGNPQTLNLYSYLAGNPLTDTDPTGFGPGDVPPCDPVTGNAPDGSIQCYTLTNNQIQDTTKINAGDDMTDPWNRFQDFGLDNDVELVPTDGGTSI